MRYCDHCGDENVPWGYDDMCENCVERRICDSMTEFFSFLDYNTSLFKSWPRDYWRGFRIGYYARRVYVNLGLWGFSFAV